MSAASLQDAAAGRPPGCLSTATLGVSSFMILCSKRLLVFVGSGLENSWCRPSGLGRTRSKDIGSRGIADEKGQVGRERENSWREQEGERMVIRLSGGCISLFSQPSEGEPGFFDRQSMVDQAVSGQCMARTSPTARALCSQAYQQTINALPLSLFIVSCRRSRFVAGMRPCTDWPVSCGTVRYSIVQPVRYRIYILSRKRKATLRPFPGSPDKELLFIPPRSSGLVIPPSCHLMPPHATSCHRQSAQ